MTSREQGFTLLELLVAMVLLAIVAGLLVTGGRTMAGLRDGLQERGEALAEAAVAADTIRSRLGDAVFVDIGEPGKTQAAFEGERDRLRFVSMQRDYERGFPQVAWELTVDSSRGRSRLIVRFADFPFDQIEFGDLDWGEERTLASLAGDLRLAYFGRADSDDDPAWHDQWEEQARLPRAVSLTSRQTNSKAVPFLFKVQAQVPSLCASTIDSAIPTCTPP